MLVGSAVLSCNAAHLSIALVGQHEGARGESLALVYAEQLEFRVD